MGRAGARRRGPEAVEPELITIFWRDIPAQVTARRGRDRAGAELPDRFQRAIDRAATRAGRTAADAYLAEWREQRTACDDDLETVVRRASTLLDEAFPEEVLDRYVGNDGWAP